MLGQQKIEDFSKEEGGPSIVIGNVDITKNERVEHMELSEESLAARERHQQLLDEFERKRLARSVVVPTDDVEVRIKLRESGEPITLFGEDAHDRRMRLREVLLALELGTADEPLQKRAKTEKGEASGLSAKLRAETIYSRGSAELASFRKRIAAESLTRASHRLEEQREHAANLRLLIEARHQRQSRLVAFTSVASQVTGSRPLSAATFAPTNVFGDKKAVTGDFDGVVKVWSVPGCTEEYEFAAHRVRILGMAVHAPSGVLATSSMDGTAAMFDLRKAPAVSESGNGKLLTAQPAVILRGHKARVNRVVFHPLCNVVATSSHDTSWRLWDAERGEQLLLQDGHTGPVFDVAYQRDGALAVSASQDGYGRIWDLRTGKCVEVLKGHSRGVVSADFAANGYQVGTGSEDNTVRIWDLRKRESVYTIPAHSGLVSSVKFHSDSTGPFLVTGSFDQSIKLWAGDTFELVKSLTGHEQKVMACALADDGEMIVSACYDRTLKLWAHEDYLLS